MLTNYHTHSLFCDGKNSPEDTIKKALEKGFSALGFSGHILTPFDSGYCIKDLEGYKSEIKRLKEKYKKDIQIYLGIEEDIFSLSSRADYDYIIGSCHYIEKDGKYYPLDFSYDKTVECINALGGDPLKYAEVYFKSFCDYISERKPDIIGHFDLITKFEEKNEPLFFGNEKYFELAKKYLTKAAEGNCIFEINTGAISRGYRVTPYPAENLLYALKALDAKIMLSSDCHDNDYLDCDFDKTRLLLKDIGFKDIWHIYDNKFIKEKI